MRQSSGPVREPAEQVVKDIRLAQHYPNLTGANLKSGLGLGEHQVTKEVDRIEKSIGITIIAYLVLIRARKTDISPGRPWSISQLKNNFTTDVICNQFQHNMRRKLNRLMKAA